MAGYCSLDRKKDGHHIDSRHSLSGYNPFV